MHLLTAVSQRCEQTANSAFCDCPSLVLCHRSTASEAVCVSDKSFLNIRMQIAIGVFGFNVSDISSCTLLSSVYLADHSLVWYTLHWDVTPSPPSACYHQCIWLISGNETLGILSAPQLHFCDDDHRNYDYKNHDTGRTICANVVK